MDKDELIRLLRADPDVRAALREAVAPGDTVRVARATMIEAGVPFGLESVTSEAAVARVTPAPGRSRPVPPWLESIAARHGKPPRDD